MSRLPPALIEDLYYLILILQNIVQCSLGVTWSLLYCLFGVLSKKETCFRDKKDKKGQRGQIGTKNKK